jgi:ribonuclease H2 subunit A
VLLAYDRGTRDAALEVFAEVEDGYRVALGSGYPGDEKTKNWLRQSIDPVFGWDGRVARFLWRTVLDMIEGNCAKALGADRSDDDNEACDRKITGIFGGGGADGGKGLQNWYGSSVQADS